MASARQVAGRLGKTRVASARREAVKDLLTRPSPPEGAFIAGPWGFGLTSEHAERLLRKWKKLLTIAGLTSHEIAADMAGWG